MKFNNVFSKGKIGNIEVKNRVVMPAMGVGLSNSDGTPSDKMIGYYEERAKGGVGLIITEITRVNDEHGVGEIHQLCVTKDEHIEPLKKFAHTIHKHGTKVFAQLHHPGRQTFSGMIGGQPVVAPSPIKCGVCQQETRALTTEEIKSLVKDFVKGAQRVKAAGIDGVELHGAHGYLINQFLSPYTNKRKDEYGGSFENRMRFIKEIISGIKETCGDYPISVRISADEFLGAVGIPEKGIDLEEGVKIAKYLEKLGIDVINVSAGTYETMNTTIEPISFPQGWKSHLSKAIKEAIDIPVIVTNVIKKPDFADELIESGLADFVALGRAHLADPEWANKAKEGREEEIRYCISCLHCVETLLTKVLPEGGLLECACNPRLGRELDFNDLKKNGSGKVVAVIGAGPSGMEAARILALRGFKPVILEKQNQVGGQLQLANKPPHKDKVTWLIDNMLNQLNKLGVEIRLNEDVSIDVLKKLNPYAVFVATGSNPLVPPIEGSEKENVCTAWDILSGKVKLESKKVAVIGSGMTGLETSELLAEQGNKVSVIEMLDKIGPGAHIQNLLDVTMRLNEYGAEMLPSHKLQKITDMKVVLEDLINTKVVEKEVDHVVLSIGSIPNNGLVEDIKANFHNVKIIGDANGIGKIVHAISAGFEEGYNL